MEDSEKLTALKKAYAEVILNTAKEAAARIMISERKSVRYQRELSTVKDEVLHMLVRLKHMLDSKVSEAEKASLSQTKKIEELEAQLEEAEDIVRDLRAELQLVQDELEKVANNKLPTEQNLEGSNDTKLEMVSTFENQSAMIRTPEGNEYDGASDSLMNNGYVHDSDFASVRMRSKEPDLYKNGCTQRIRAFERNTLDGSLCFSEKADDMKIGTFIRENEEAKGMNLTPGHNADSICEVEKKLDIPKMVLIDNSDIRGHILNKCCRKRKREVKYNKTTFDPYCLKSFSADIIDQSENISLKSVEEDTLFSTAANDPAETTEIITSSGIDANESDEAFITKHNKEDLDKIESLNGQGCKTDDGTVKEMILSMEKKDSDLNDRNQSESPDGKFLKYTFRRKRKKEHLNSPNGSTFLEECMLDKENGEKQTSPLGSEKSSTMFESSQDGQQLASVVHQLVCLSENQW